MRGLVLVGGEGTRLRPLTLSAPKQMLPVAEQPMIERVVGQLASAGVGSAVLSLGYRPEAFVAAYPDGVVAGVRVDYAVEDQPLGTAGAIAFAAGQAGICDTFIAANGDVLTDMDLGALVELHRTRRAEATIHLVAVPDPSAFGVVSTDESGAVVEFVEKPAPGRAPSNLVNAGTYVLEPSVLELVEPGRPVSIEREVFPILAERRSLYALASDAYWIDAGTPSQYLRANRDLVGGRRPGPPAPGARLAAPGVWVVDGARLRGEVAPPSLVGRGAEVSAGARVVGSCVGCSSSVAAGARVLDSVLLAGCQVGPGALVEDSILGEGA
ncbi:MAG TPA: NDP-sugar synthase, partial [Acidimicrobiales bacterium]|nr:NDP-sugar synthase [Acidimicrobiales bacterium]